MGNRKYILDPADLQYKQVRLPWKQKILRFLLWFTLSLIISGCYIKIFENKFGSPKEKLLGQQVESIKLQYSMLDRKFGNAFKTLDYLKESDEMRFRPILHMDSIPSSYRNPGYGGVDRFREFAGYENYDLIVLSHQKLESLMNISKVQDESFNDIEDQKNEWIRENEYLPKISPVDVSISKGDGIVFRKHHPVLGTPQWHFGQDFNAPYGTEVYATGAGKVIASGWNSEGFGYHVIIDHGYGFHSIYGHLSKINVPVGLNVRRGDLVGLSGDSGQSSGPHLHYQIDFNGNHQNPLDYFSDDLTPEEYREMIMTLGSKSKFR
jgi:murein DD-endopeptidase MepM/ murein hydrolase activator NlpD